MKMERRDFLRTFLRTLTGSVLAGSQWKPAQLFAASALRVPAPEPPQNGILPSNILINARGKYRPVQPSLLRLGGSRPGKDGASGEKLSFTNLYLQHSATTPDAAQHPRPFIPVTGEFHYARFPWQGWEDELRKMKAGGITIVSTYIFWILHEQVEGQFLWTERRNLRLFLDLCAKVGLQVILRVGPFAHGEMRNGGLPDWLYGKPFPARSNHPAYLECVRKLYQQIGEQARGHLYQDGGPVIGVQIENEFMAATAPWEVSEFREEQIEWIPTGSGGAEHLSQLKQIAIESGLHVPIFTCTAWGSPIPEYEFLPMHGGYGFEPWSVNAATHQQPPSWSYVFLDTQPALQPDGKKTDAASKGGVPFTCCELGGGMQCFYKARFVVPPESVQAIAVTSLGSGCVMLGYYMFHGGSNPAGESVFYNEYDVPHISYDFQAPIREHGQIAPSYRLLRPIHIFLASYGSLLAPMETALPAGAEAMLPTDAAQVRCAIRTAGGSGFLFLNNYQDHVSLPERSGLSFRIALDGGEMRIPEQGGFGIGAGESAILPFGISLGFVSVRYATAQLITEITHENKLHVFFFAPQGMRPEFCIDTGGATQCSAPGAIVERRGKHLFIHGEPGKAFDIECSSGQQTVILHLLVRESSLRISRFKLWGEERIIFSDADTVELDGNLLARQTADAPIRAHVFPAPSGAQGILATSSSVPAGTAEYHATIPAWPGGVSVERLAEDEMRVSLAGGFLTGVEDVLLRIHYYGDIGQAFADGHLIADNFCNGAPWEIGLRYLQEHMRERTLILKVVPFKQGGAVILDANVPHPERFHGDRIASIDSVEAVPIYKACFTASGALR